MRKHLLRTSAIALVVTNAFAARAAEWEVTVGGYMEQYLAFASSDAADGGDYDGIDSKQDAEIHFTPSITLDNGLKIGADIQLEGATGGDQIDESSLFIDGAFGRVLLGSEASAGYLMFYAAPDVTFLNVNSGSTTAFIPYSGSTVGADVFLGTLGTTYLENVLNDNAQRFTYFSPRFAGVQLGVSYARDTLQDTNAQINTDGEVHDLFDIGANYVQTFGDFNIALAGRWGTAAAPGPDPDIWGLGLNLGYGGFTVGGSYAKQNDAGAQDGSAYDAGISYYTGPWGFSVTYFHGKNVDDENPTNPFGNDETLKQYLVGVSYVLADGVTLNGFGAYVDFEEDNGDAGGNVAAAPGDDVDGFIIGTGIKVEF